MIVGAAAAAIAAACSPAGLDRAELEALAVNDFVIENDRTKSFFLLELPDCTASPDPFFRDEVGYEALAAILRRDALETELLDRLVRQYSSQLRAGVRRGGETLPASFAALGLSELARRDRVEPYLTERELGALVRLATRSLAAWRDYRGFVDGEGWHHGIAHLADLHLQLALNPRLSDRQQDALRTALLSQVQPETGHFYIYGEPYRLARAFLYSANQSDLGAEQASDLFSSIDGLAASETWDGVYTSRSGLAQLHNTRAFLSAVVMMLEAADDDPTLTALREAAVEGYRALP